MSVPLAWQFFQYVFESILDKCSKHLSVAEMATLLFEALETRAAKDIVTCNFGGGPDYVKAKEAFAWEFGEIHVIVYPMLIQTINESDKFNCESRKCMIVFSPCHYILSIDSDSLSQYLVLFIKQSSAKLREKWNRQNRREGRPANAGRAIDNLRSRWHRSTKSRSHPYIWGIQLAQEQTNQVSASDQVSTLRRKK